MARPKKNVKYIIAKQVQVFSSLEEAAAHLVSTEDDMQLLIKGESIPFQINRTPTVVFGKAEKPVEAPTEPPKRRGRPPRKVRNGHVPGESVK